VHCLVLRTFFLGNLGELNWRRGVLVFTALNALVSEYEADVLSL
jgi:hypothetical protein